MRKSFPDWDTPMTLHASILSCNLKAHPTHATFRDVFNLVVKRPHHHGIVEAGGPGRIYCDVSVANHAMRLGTRDLHAILQVDSGRDFSSHVRGHADAMSLRRGYPATLRASIRSCRLKAYQTHATCGDIFDLFDLMRPQKTL
jgi:hypothetical protein